MKAQRIAVSAGCTVGMLILILDSTTALSGAESGIKICMNTLVPSLFPFFVLSILLTGTLSGWTYRFLHPLCKICKIPKGCESILLTGLLGGYPVGAQCVGQTYAAGTISRHEASRMLGFCNNAGPAFIFGVIAHAFEVPYIPWLLWSIHVISAVIVGILLPGNVKASDCNQAFSFITWPQALRKAITVTASVCGWVILFRIVLAFLNKWLFHYLSSEMVVLLSGFLELANGCILLQDIPNTGLRFILASVMLAGGGICVAMQTSSVIHQLPLKFYIAGKSLQICISLLLAGIAQIILPAQMQHLMPPVFITAVAIILAIIVFGLKKQWNFSGMCSIIGALKERGNCHVIPKEN